MERSIERANVQASWLTSIRDAPEEFRASGDVHGAGSAMDIDFLLALESSGSAGPQQGYVAMHLLFSDSHGPLALAPGYLRDRSDGDFSWDWSWAKIAHQAGIPWWPKYVWGIPATPFGRYRVLFRRGLDLHQEQGLITLMLDEVRSKIAELGVGTFQILFPHKGMAALLKTLNLSPMLHQRFSLDLRGLESFSDYLALFDKNQRRNIKRERQSLASAGLEVRRILPASLGADEQVFWAYHVWNRYREHNENFGPWSAQWLEESFFLRLFELCHCSSPQNGLEPVIFAAFAPGEHEPLGLSFLLRKGPLLMGRYWGARLAVPNLHFELCFYSPIEWAISQGIEIFDPGSGSEHKLRRGFFADEDWSFHYFSDQRLRNFFAKNVEVVNKETQDYIEMLNAQVPVKDMPHL